MKIGLIDVERWTNVSGYENLYQVSNVGRIKKKNRIMKSSKDSKGYLTINLIKGRVYKNWKVHRLVAINFIGKSDKKCVCHKDNDPSNNNVNNLYWGTDLENQQQAWKDGLHKSRMSVCSIDLYGVETKYISQAEASRKTKIAQQNISKCIKGTRKSAGGLKWIKK